MPQEKSNKRLGRGLDALFNSPSSSLQENETFRELPIDQISSNPFQPRKTFKPEELLELQESLKTSGLLQPITVRPSPNGKGYELIAGERRLRAAGAVGWTRIPAVIKQLNDQELLTLALIENLQRSDLNPIEEAEGYDQLIKQFGHTQQTVASMVGKDRSTIANTLRILQLPVETRKLVEEGHLTAGQVRPFLALADKNEIIALAQRAVDEGWSAREVERRVRSTEPSPPKQERGRRGRPRKQDERPAEIRRIEQLLMKHFQTDAQIILKEGNRGTVAIDFYSVDDLDRLLELIGISKNPQ